MSPEVITVKPDQPLEEIWNLLRSHHIRGVPVTDKAGEIVGMVAIADFLKLADWRMCNTLVARMKFLVSRKKINTAEQIMTSPVIVGHKNMPMTEAFLLFAKNGINHLPIVDDEGELVGILTRLDLLSALYVNPAAIAPGYR